MLNLKNIFERMMEVEGVKTKKAIAESLGISAPDLHGRAKRGTLIPLILEWAINRNVSLDWLIKGVAPKEGTVQNHGILNTISHMVTNGNIHIGHGGDYPKSDGGHSMVQSQETPYSERGDRVDIHHISAIVGAIQSMDAFLKEKEMKIADDKKTAIILLLDQGIVKD